MSGSGYHRLDRRATKLADKIVHRMAVLRAVFHPEGENPPFTKQLTSDEALTFWRKHRFSPTGQKILGGWGAGQIAGLDRWLAQHPDPAIRERPLTGSQLPAPGFGPPNTIGAALPTRNTVGGPLPQLPRSAPLQDVGD